MIQHALPQIIQGGMGVGVSNWRLARSVSLAGQMGVVSGTALDVVLARRLQQGDPGGNMLHALRHFPIREVAMRVIDRYFIHGGKADKVPYAGVPMIGASMSKDHIGLLVVANFVEVYLAKERHPGLVGINLLEKIQAPTLAALYGAMLAGVDYVLMGAGIPNRIPGVLDLFAAGADASLRLDVSGAPKEAPVEIHFSPRELMQGEPPLLKRPYFLPIISSATLALTLARKANGRVDGFIIEGSQAGGHNAPPRGGGPLNERGEPVYGLRDEPDLERIRDLGLPFWLAGSYGGPGSLQRALALGAAGIQVGTAFAFCQESGISNEIKAKILQQVKQREVDVFTDPLASPTGFPFKVVRLAETEDLEVGQRMRRRRPCDIGLLRQAYQREDGTLGYRCPSEPIHEFIKKGGEAQDVLGRKCICNGLLATIGLGQCVSHEQVEPGLVTAGDSLAEIVNFLPMGMLHYSAEEVLAMLLHEEPAAEVVVGA
jgi:nitronate monooxygenase